MPEGIVYFSAVVVEVAAVADTALALDDRGRAACADPGVSAKAETARAPVPSTVAVRRRTLCMRSPVWSLVPTPTSA